MPLSDTPPQRQHWDGVERRHGFNPDYTGPERRNPRLSRIEQQQRILQVGHVQLVTQMGEMSTAMTAAVAEGMKQALTDPAVLQSIWEAALKEGQKGLHQQAGKWLFSRWTAIAALILLVANYIGWPATIKALIGLGKGG